VQSKTPTTTQIQVTINNEKVVAIVDSGAAGTLISKTVWQTMNTELLNPKRNKKWINASGDTMKCIGKTIITIKFGEYTIQHKCVVIDGLQSKMLIGTDFLQKHGCIIDYTKGKIKIGTTELNIKTSTRQEEACLILQKTIHLAAKSESIHLIQINTALGDELLLENIKSKDNVWIRDGLVKITNGKIPIIIQNKNPFNVTLEKKTSIGKVTSIKQVLNIEPPTKSRSDTKLRASELINWSNCPQSNQWIFKVKELINKYDHVFSKHPADLGRYDKEKFEINTNNAKPIRQRPYRVPQASEEHIDNMVDEMLNSGLITKSNSPWASPIVLVKKKDGTDRFCVDFRKLNSVTIGDSYPLPLVEDMIYKVKNASIYSGVDLASGYWQLALDEKAKVKTAFITKKGLWQFNVLPFGLCNAGAFFQRTMEQLLKDLPNSNPYLDDIITSSNDENNHLIDLERLFKTLEAANLKIKPSKCVFGAEEIKF
jgi:predicted aspartyl protease